MEILFSSLQVVAFDADDTLWDNETYFREAEEQFVSLLENYLPPHSTLRALLKTEIDNLPLYGYGIKAFVPRMLASGEEGVVINTSSSNGGLRSLPNTPIYAASKAAVTSISEVLHQQLLREGTQVRAAILFPGPNTVNTSIMASNLVRPDEYAEGTSREVAYRTMQELVEKTGLKISLTEPEEVADFAVDGVKAGRFWLLPESETGDAMLRDRMTNILARVDPPSAW